MAVYSLELMQRVSNQYVYDNARSRAHLMAGLLSADGYGLTSAKPLMHREDVTGSTPLGLNKITRTNLLNGSPLANQPNVFDPFGAMSYADTENNVLKREGEQLTIDMMGWVMTSSMARMLNPNDELSLGVWELFIYQEYNPNGNRYYHTFPIMRLDFAVRSKHDPDVPSSWVGSKKPDVRFIIDPTENNFRFECTDMTFDATTLFCESNRYAVDGDVYRNSFIQKPYTAV